VRQQPMGAVGAPLAMIGIMSMRGAGLWTASFRVAASIAVGDGQMGVWRRAQRHRVIAVGNDDLHGHLPR